MRIQSIVSVVSFGLLVTACTQKSSTGGSEPAVDAGTDAGAAMVVLASGQNAPSAIAIDDQNVYWLNAHTLGGFYKAPKTGGPRAALYEGDLGDVHSFVTDATSLYYVFNGNIMALPLTGGAPRTVTPAHPNLIAIGGGNLYWVEYVEPPNFPTSDAGASDPGYVRRVPVEGGATTSIPLPASIPRERLVGFTAQALATSPDAFYAGTNLGILRVPFAGETASLLGEVDAMAMTIADGTIYFAMKDAVAAVPISGGTPQVLAPAQTPGPVVADGAFVFYSEGASTSGRISKVPKSTGAVTIVANTATRAGSLAIDATSIYWSSTLEGTVRKAPK